MSHLDEGRLHAYLDGERQRESDTHLSVCADCRQRLDEARRLRDRAGAILRAGGPGLVTTPPFEQIIERKRRVTPRRAPRTVVLVWAATVALALGIGWYARSLVLREPGTAADVAVSPIIAQAPPPGAAAAPPLRPDAPTARERIAAPTEPPRQLADRLVGAPPVQDPAPALARTTDSTREADTRRNTHDLARLMVERVSAGAGAPPAPAQPVAGPADEREVWVPVSRAEAERRLDDQLAALPELETLGTTVKEGAGVPQARTVQRLPDGRSIELIQERIPVEKREEAPERLRRVATPAPAAAAAAAPGREAAQAPATATVEWSNSRVTARGPLPADSLRALLQRLRRAQP